MSFEIGGGGGGGRSGSIGDYQGQFTATTVRQRAFDANDYIAFDDGTDIEVFLAPVAIPINSPAPKANGALWAAFTAAITSGVSRADLDAALSTKANASSLANYLRTATYTLDKARFESGITGNDNDIAALIQSLNTLQTQVNNLPTGGGGEGGSGGVTTAALNTAIDNLRTVLQGRIDTKQDASTAATDTELSTAISNLRTTLQASINTLSTRVGNIPVSAEVLWATSKVLPSTNVTSTIDADWVLSSDVPTGVVVDGDIIDIPESLRGDLHVDFVNASDELILRRVTPIQIGNTNLATPLNNRLRVSIAQDSTDANVLNLTLNARQAASFPAGTKAKVYGLTSLPRSQVAAVTQDEIDALDGRVMALESGKLDAEDFYIDVWPRYISSERLGGNIIFIFSHVPAKYQTANQIRIMWDGVPVYRNVWNPSTEFVLFSIAASSLDNLRVALGASPSRLAWQVQVRFYRDDVELGLENAPVLIDRG